MDNPQCEKDDGRNFDGVAWVALYDVAVWAAVFVVIWILAG